MPKKKSVSTVNLDDVTFDAAFEAFNEVASQMEHYRDCGANGDASASYIPVRLMKSAATTTDAAGAPHELLVRGLTQSNVAAMKNTIGISGSLSSTNFLVREEFVEVPEAGACLFSP